MKCTDYLYCEDCKTFVDLWKFDSVADAGHGDCNWRYATEEELPELVGHCQEAGCFPLEGD